MNQNYLIENDDKIETPSLVFYKEIVERNINKMIEIIGDTNRLVPHIKTNKTIEIIRLMIDKGIYQFKCSTIAEAELIAIAEGKKAIVAHQLVGPKLERFLALTLKYPNTSFATLVDDISVITTIQNLFESVNKVANVFIDVNSGMNRSGAELCNLEMLTKLISESKNLNFEGWHVYDGHQRDEEFIDRKNKIEAELSKFYNFLAEHPLYNTTVIAGGTPAFTVHAKNKNRLCSPGTCVLWDWGYGDKFKEQPFEYAALVATRIISKPTKGIITIDMGHKAIAAENPINKRVRFLNLEGYELVSQSEEHGVVKVENWDNLKVGDLLLGVPYHVCPTVNLYDTANVIFNKNKTEEWEILGRKRKITI